MAASAWIIPTTAASTAGGMMSGHMMNQSSSQVVIDAGTYYWHIVPGILAILVSAAVVLFSGGALVRWLAIALGLLAVWSAAGPWVLPQFGMGSMMMSGVTGGSFVRHIVPGIALAVCAVGIFLSVPARDAEAAGAKVQLEN